MRLPWGDCLCSRDLADRDKNAFFESRVCVIVVTHV